MAFVCERARGRLKVMAGTGSNSTAEAIRMTKAAKKAGADGTLQVGPYYNKPTQEGYFRHFAAIAEAMRPAAWSIYNIPGRTGSEIAAETIARMAEKCPTVVAVKEATGKLDMASQIAALCRPDDPQRRRQPDAADHERRRQGRGERGRATSCRAT